MNLEQAIAAALNKQKGLPLYKERVNTNSISLVLNTRACAVLNITRNGEPARQLSLRADTRKQADALIAELESKGIVRG